MTHNNITGDKIATKATTKAYRDGWEAIFGKKKQPTAEPVSRKACRKLGNSCACEFGKCAVGLDTLSAAYANPVEEGRKDEHLR